MTNENINPTNNFSLKKLVTSKGSVAFIGTVISILMGLLLGFILLLAFNAPFAVSGMTMILTKGFSELIKRRFVLGSYILQKENQERLFLNAQRVRHIIVDKMNEFFKEGLKRYSKDSKLKRLSDEMFKKQNETSQKFEKSPERLKKLS